MSYGIPSISSQQVINNFDAIKSKFLPYYKSEEDFIKLIIKLKENKNFSMAISNKCLGLIKNFKWKKTLRIFNRIL